MPQSTIVKSVALVGWSPTTPSALVSPRSSAVVSPAAAVAGSRAREADHGQQARDADALGEPGEHEANQRRAAVRCG